MAGMSGYFMFYHQVNSNILDNFPYNDIIATIARILITLNILISVPYGCFMPRVSIYLVFNLLFGPIKYLKTFHIVVTIGVLGSALLVAEFVTDLGITFSFLGAFAAVEIAYLLPTACFLKLEQGHWTTPKKLLHVVIFIFGIFTTVGSVYAMVS